MRELHWYTNDMHVSIDKTDNIHKRYAAAASRLVVRYII